MNEARKALINIQKASPGLPVGRFHPQLAIIADFFDTLVATTTERDKLHRQLAEAHECFGTLLAEMATPPDQAAVSAAFIRGNRLGPAIMDNAKAGKITTSAVAALKNFDIVSIKNFDTTEFNRDDQVPQLANINGYYGKTGGPTRAESPAPPGFKMTEVFGTLWTYQQMRDAGWNDKQLLDAHILVPDHA